MIRLSIAAVMVAATLASTAANERSGTPPPWMDETDLKVTFAGRTIAGEYRNGSAFSETYFNEGQITYSDSYRATQGRWSITNGAFCTIYDDDPTGGCFRVMRSGGNCFEFYFVARTEQEALQPRDPDWSARAWMQGETATCADGANV